jgi:uncharacterized protein YecT (DUF1311 family)
MKSIRLHVLAAILSLAISVPASADIWSECDTGPNILMTKCIWDRYEAADAELNEVWKQALATIVPSEFMTSDQAAEWKAELVAAQRSWVTFKDKDCKGAVAYEWFGGSGANAAIGACLYEHTRSRIDDLRERDLNR